MAGGGDAEAKTVDSNPGASATPNGSAKAAAVKGATQHFTVGS